MTVVLVFAGAVVGAPLRYLTDQVVRGRYEGRFPWGTLIVNLVGCLVLGGLAGAATVLPAPVMALVGTGFCGALTTYSTFGYETVRLVEAGEYRQAAVNVVVSVVAGVGLATVAFMLTQALTS